MFGGNGDGFDSPINKPDPRSGGSKPSGGKGGEFQTPTSKEETGGAKN